MRTDGQVRRVDPGLLINANSDANTLGRRRDAGSREIRGGDVCRQQLLLRLSSSAFGWRLHELRCGPKLGDMAVDVLRRLSMKHTSIFEMNTLMMGDSPCMTLCREIVQAYCISLRYSQRSLNDSH